MVSWGFMVTAGKASSRKYLGLCPKQKWAPSIMQLDCCSLAGAIAGSMKNGQSSGSWSWERFLRASCRLDLMVRQLLFWVLVGSLSALKVSKRYVSQCNTFYGTQHLFTLVFFSFPALIFTVCSPTMSETCQKVFQTHSCTHSAAFVFNCIYSC